MEFHKEDYETNENDETDEMTYTFRKRKLRWQYPNKLLACLTGTARLHGSSGTP